MRADRYLHRRNRTAEKHMIECRENRECQRLICGYVDLGDMEDIDVEALISSLLMTPSHQIETAEIKKALLGFDS